uniref:ATP synthase F1 subunit gamma n=1 Tax=Fundulus heteroclitus TaxID=8078 RepID=A0A3Q2P7A4_FUNHE
MFARSITLRLKSIKNIQKITKSMKMVAAAKYARAERQLKPARVYGGGALALYEKADIKAPEEKATKHLIVGVTSDRGLCGGIHSGVAKTIKSEIASLTNSGKEVMVINVGDKLRGLLYRYALLFYCIYFNKVHPLKKGPFIKYPSIQIFPFYMLLLHHGQRAYF